MKEKVQPPLLNRVYADNGEFSHWQLIDPTTGENLWSQDPNEDAAQCYPVKPSGEKQRLSLQEALNQVARDCGWTDWANVTTYSVETRDMLFNRAAELYASQLQPIPLDFQDFTQAYQKRQAEVLNVLYDELKLKDARIKELEQSLQPIREKPDFEKLASQYLKSLGQRSDIEWEVKQYGNFGERIWKNYVELSGNKKESLYNHPYKPGDENIGG